MAPKPDRLAFVFGMVLAMAVTILGRGRLRRIPRAIGPRRSRRGKQFTGLNAGICTEGVGTQPRRNEPSRRPPSQIAIRTANTKIAIAKRAMPMPAGGRKRKNSIYAPLTRHYDGERVPTSLRHRGGEWLEPRRHRIPHWRASPAPQSEQRCCSIADRRLRDRAPT